MKHSNGVSQEHRLMCDIYVLLDDGDRRVLAPLGLTPLEYSILQLLDLDQGQRLTDIGAALLCVKSTITRTVDRLEADGLVRRTPDPDDRRAQRLVLTPHGVALRERAYRAHSDSVAQRLQALSSAEREQLGQLLLKLREGLRDGIAR